MRITFVALALILLSDSNIVAQGTTYAFDVRSRDNFLTFPADDPVDLSFINGNTSPFAIDFNLAGDALYAIDSNSDTVGTLDQMNGKFTSVAQLNGDFTNGTIGGLSVDPTDGQFFMSTGTTLYQLDVNTGATTLVGDFLDSGAPIGTAVSYTHLTLPTKA